MGHQIHTQSTGTEPQSVGTQPYGPQTFEQPPEWVDFDQDIQFIGYDLSSVSVTARNVAAQSQYQPNVPPDVLRNLEDLADIAEVNARLLSRQSENALQTMPVLFDVATTTVAQMEAYPDPQLVEAMGSIRDVLDEIRRFWPRPGGADGDGTRPDGITGALHRGPDPAQRQPSVGTSPWPYS